MKRNNTSVKLLSDAQVDCVTGAGFFYEIGAFFARQANISDSIRDQYGNTNRNHW